MEGLTFVGATKCLQKVLTSFLFYRHPKILTTVDFFVGRRPDGRQCLTFSFEPGKIFGFPLVRPDLHLRRPGLSVSGDRRSRNHHEENLAASGENFLPDSRVEVSYTVLPLNDTFVSLNIIGHLLDAFV